MFEAGTRYEALLDLNIHNHIKSGHKISYT
ncbi:hypothetical protein F383_32019 [Gossypium arboreum]|uniref:Uncharacterized protein n=1 Tax=Gossypium arboreum TaxID=29729 RepID=A0A0B0N1B2_GOSAR|nr:hypothetical protein F383_32019 [Gossypium arboreum]